MEYLLKTWFGLLWCWWYKIFSLSGSIENIDTTFNMVTELMRHSKNNFMHMNDGRPTKSNAWCIKNGTNTNYCTMHCVHRQLVSLEIHFEIRMRETRSETNKNLYNFYYSDDHAWWKLREPKGGRVMVKLDKDLIGFTYAHRFNFNIEYFNRIFNAIVICAWDWLLTLGYDAKYT